MLPVSGAQDLGDGPAAHRRMGRTAIAKGKFMFAEVRLHDTDSSRAPPSTDDGNVTNG
jgi:hypothetical protein